MHSDLSLSCFFGIEVHFAACLIWWYLEPSHKH